MIAPIKWLLDLIYPPKCVLCGRLLSEDEARVCKRCLMELPVNPLEVPDVEFVEHCVSPFVYRDTLRESLLRYKFGGRQHYADFYGLYMAACIRERLSVCDLISWVPISRRRRAAREDA